MARFISDGKLYDTDTAQKVCTFQKGFKGIIDIITVYKPATLYKTVKGTWFTVCEVSTNELRLFEETEESAKELLSDINTVELYIKFIGKPEEA